MFKKIIIMTGLILLLPAAGFAGKVNVKRLAMADWIRFETENFNVFTDAGEERALELVRELEHFKFFLDTVLGLEQKPLSQKVSVIAAKDIRTFKSTGIPGVYSGIFTAGYGYSIFVQCDGFRSSSKGKSRAGRKTVFHELVHLFIHNSFSAPAVHPWFDEGMAEYFSTYTEKDGTVTTGDIGVHKNRFNSILKMSREQENVDTETLFKTTAADLNIFNTTRRHGRYQDKFYAHSLLTVHYMLSDSDSRERFFQYIHLLDKGLSIDESFKLAFNMTFSALDNKINRYIIKSGLNAGVFDKDKIIFSDVKFTRHEITKKDALGFMFLNISVLPDKFLSDKNFEKLVADAERLYPGLVNDIIRQQLMDYPEDRPVLARAANIYSRMKRYGEAVTMYERAILAGEPDAFTLNNYAWLLATMEDTGMRNPARAVELAGRAVFLEKTPERLDTLAEAYYAGGSFQMAIKTAGEAIAIGTWDNTYLKKQLRKFKKAFKKQRAADKNN